MSNNLGQIRLYELGDRILRSWWTIVAGISLGLSVAVAVLQLAPQVFEGTAVLQMKSERMTGALNIPSTVGSDITAQLETLKLTVLSSENMERIAAELFDPPNDAEQRDAVLRSLRSGISGRYSALARELRVSYRSDDPLLAAAVANAVAGLFVEEYRRQRSGLAQENTRILETLMAPALKELQAKNDEIRDFRARNASELDLEANARLLDELTTALQANRNALEEAEGRIRDLRDQEDLTEAFGSMSRATTPRSGNHSSRLPELRRQLEELRFRYSDSHPDIQTLKRQIEEAEKTSREDQDSDSSPQQEQLPPRTALDPLKGYIQVEQREADQLKTEGREIRARIQRLQELIGRGDLVQQELNDLSLGRDILEGNYSAARQRVALARAAEIAEENQISGELVVQSEAAPPSGPISPKPMPVIGASVVAALLLFVGPLVARWFLVPVVGSEAELLTLSEAPILVTVPRLATPHVHQHIRRRRARNVGLSILSAAILAGTVALFWFG